ncbi:MAG: DUF5343 domain-containing protein [Actinomycetota bacterium]
MALPSTYLTSTKNLRAILSAIRQAQAPKTFTTRFLEGLGYKSSSDRLVIGVLKTLRFLSSTGLPTERYFGYLDESESPRILAEGLREAYADLFELNTNAQEMDRNELKNKMKTLTQGQHSDSVLDKMAMTFKALSEQADFSSPPAVKQPVAEDEEVPESETPETETEHAGKPAIKGLVYNIELHLPESRDPSVYDALFKSLREHLG